MSNQTSAANNTCRIFVLIVFLVVIGVFLLAFAMPGNPSLEIRRHFSHTASAASE